jgi:methenyltetrahydrofolate cyclohydrolase
MRLVERTVDGFLAELGSASPAPGGGSCAALAGALAASLAAMACRLTLGRKRFEPAWPLMRECLAEAESLGARLRGLVDEDSDAYNAVVAARRMPGEPAGEAARRDLAVREATERSARVPLETLETAARLAAVVRRVAEASNPSCATDVGSAAALLRAAAASAAYNVRVNLPDIGDQGLRRDLADAARASSAVVEEAVTAVTARVDATLEQRSTT